ncbi:MarR family winged helix-turn-helix transcriptional regulator [Alteribacter populi]|uniref:MarR family winged helix-turn-helix transcriptional regulator n=1 Tax=Alteribacter populi TaxID=2011011 RepID=UPI000BBA7DB6|nr:winged helix DNA-binding protein [Alteribacter populi]
MERENIIKELEDVIFDINLFLKHEFGNEFCNQFKKKFLSLSPNQQMVLFLVDKKGINQVKDISLYLNISTSAVSQLVGKLVRLDILHRKVEESNRRNTLIEIGPKGRVLLNEMDQIKSTIFHKYLSKMEEEDLLIFKNSFKNFLRIIADSQEDQKA